VDNLLGTSLKGRPLTPVKIALGRKGLPGKNTLAYLAHLKTTKKKVL
jgi:hypothetical protein